MKNQKVKAVDDIKLYQITIPKGAIGYRSRWPGWLKKYKDDDSCCVKFPDHWHRTFVTFKTDVIDIN